MLGLVSATPALSEPPAGERRLTEEQSVRAALARTDFTALLESSLGVARSDLTEAQQLPNPTLDYERQRIGGSPYDAVEQTYRLSQRLDLSGRRGLRQNAAQARLGAASADTEARRLELAAEIRRRFYETLARREALDAVQRWAERMQAIEAIIVKLERGGDASGYDRRRLTRERIAAEARRKSEQAEYARAWERLIALLGEPNAATRYQGVAGSLLPASPPPLERLLSELPNRPDLKSLAQRADAFGLDRQAAQRGWFPEVTVGLGSKRIDEGGRNDTGLVLSLSVPLPLFDRNHAQQQRATAQVQVTRAEFQVASARAEGDVRGVWQQAIQLSEAARDFRRDAVEASTQVTRIAEAAYRGGETGVLELLDAYRGALEAETQGLELELRARMARIELDQLTGKNPQ